MTYDPLSQEPLVQAKWLEAGAFKSLIDPADPRQPYYVLVMLPYPSGRIHMGHVRNYTLGDVAARFQRMKGKAVMQPLGWDSFGLPAENAAIKHGIHPAIWTRHNIADMKAQIQRIGISYDWGREIASYLPNYYRWNQWLFLQMWKRGDVFRAMRNVNWCEALGTVLANEQVVDGKDERTGHPVVQKSLEQYFFAITKYAEELLAGLDALDWPDNVKAMQRHWIGKSEGAKLRFEVVTPGLSDPPTGSAEGIGSVDGSGTTAGRGQSPLKNLQVEVFTTRLDTLFGVSFLALSTEHPLVEAQLAEDAGLRAFCARINGQSREERMTADIKEGYPTSLYAVHPFTGDRIPVYAANYVLMDYGTGAVMGVPGHDERDYAFAIQYGLTVPLVIESESPWEPGILINSGEFTGLTSSEATDAMIFRLAGRAEGAVTFKLKDWGLSRQRYWGTPIPTVHCPDHGVQPVSEDELPVRLPEEVEFIGQGPSPLTTSTAFLAASCPVCGASARRETDTMDTFVDSSWYFLRYLDPENELLPFDKAAVDPWMPVDLYIGGIEHATMHLIYARYFHKVLRDLGMLSCDEPFQKLICQGMVLKDGFKMSKSKGNVVDPDGVLARYGADALRLFMIFAAPIEKELDWTGFDGIEGSTRFLKRLARFVDDHVVCEDQLPGKEALSPEEKTLLVKLHQTIQRITDDLGVRFQFNTVVSALMELANALTDLPATTPHRGPVTQHALERFVLLLSPVAPHLAEQLWQQLGKKGFCMLASWPTADPAFLEADEQVVVVQVNGKVRARLTLPYGITEEHRREAALGHPDVKHWLEGKEIVKVILPPGGKLVNVVVKG